MHILSIQSSVAYGHVGNSSAVFPLQCLGAEVWPIDTVQFSNHPGYGSHTGTVTPPAVLTALVDGIAARGALARCDAVLSGYIGEASAGAALLHAAGLLRAANPRGIWCCDPVIGDDGPGIYVRPGIDAFFRDKAVPHADILTPNQFELGLLTGQDCRTSADLRRAVTALQERMRPAGPKILLVTSIRTEQTPANALDILAAGPDEAWLVRTRLLPIQVNGAGDAIAAVFLYHFLRSQAVRSALEHAASAIHGLLTRTCEAGSRELLLVAARDQFTRPDAQLSAQAC